MKKISAGDMRRQIAREFPSSEKRRTKTGFVTLKLFIKDILVILHIMPYIRQIQFYWRLRKNGALRKKRFTVEIEGVKVAFVTEDPHSRLWFHKRYRSGDLHEPPVSIALARRVSSATVFADIGGHIGYYSCIAAAVNRNAQVFCFEMSHNLLPLIEANLVENHFDNVTIVHAAVAEQTKLVSYEADSLRGSLAMDISTPPNKETVKRAYIETVTLDDFFTALGLMPDLMKIDVQGAEMDVLRGGRKVIGKQHPTIFLELHPTHLVNFGSTVDDVLNFLKSYDYSLYKFSDHRTAGAPERLPDQPQFTKREEMILCL
jgi:FkbM family methyltransferase